MSFEKSTLWQSTLAKQQNDDDERSRDRLRTAYLTMRDNVAPLVAAAHIDCPGLTVHDLTHLDALWTTASLVAGPEYDITPTEAFVLGGAILLHDAAMAIAAYEGGINEIRKTAVWRDSVASSPELKEHRFPDDERFFEKDRYFRHEKHFKGRHKKYIANNLELAVEDLPSDIVRNADFAALRYNHAQHAEKLAGRAFKAANSNEDFYLLEDRGLREAYGQTIGKVAHSHHWDIDKVASMLRSQIGAMTGFPSSWTVNPIKVAALLRCADASHIDSARAPSMLFSLISPKGISNDHWNFQNRLLQSCSEDGKILFTSSTSFSEDDVNAWWLCYQTVKMIDGELRKCDSMLSVENLQKFSMSGVAGIESPKLFASYVEVEGWVPVDIGLHVSDAATLASTLGGRNLYGDGYSSPLKELIQNSADAIRARRTLESRGSEWGKICISLEETSKEDEQDNESYLLHVDDNGIGMSEAVLTGPLIDLGNSLWNSALLSFEYPGLKAKGANNIGKFGIGFFSTFVLGDEVKVISRRFQSAVTDNKMLHFKSLRDRPLLRTASEEVVPRDYVTRVSVKLHPYIFRNMKRSHIDGKEKSSIEWNIKKEIEWICATLDVDVFFRNNSEKEEQIHEHNWWEQDKSVLGSKIFGRSGIGSLDCNTLGSHCSLMFDDGDPVGFGVLRPIAEKFGLENGYVSVNGISYLDESEEYRGKGIFVGIAQGDTEDASRKVGYSIINHETHLSWIKMQSLELSTSMIAPLDKLEVASILRDYNDVDTGSLPVAYAGRKFLSFKEITDWLKEQDYIYLPVVDDYSISIAGMENIPGAALASSEFEKFVIFSATKIELRDYKLRDSDKDSGEEAADTDFELFESSLRYSGASWFLNILKEKWKKNIAVEHINFGEFTNSVLSDHSHFKLLKLSRQ